MHRNSLIAVVVALLAVPEALAQLQEPEVTIRTEKVAEGIYVLFGQGGNIGVSAGENGVFIIDDQFAPLTPKIDAALKALHPEPVRFVLNTHWHFDHTGGNEHYGDAGAVIVAHDNVRARMSVPQMMEFFKQAVPASPPGALPVVTFNDSVSFHLNGDDIRAVHVARAHTDGDVFVQFRGKNVLHAGDVFFNGSYPFVDLDSGGSIAGMIAAIDALISLADDETRIIPGHGPVSGRAELVAYRDMFFETSSRVRELKSSGKSLEEILAAAPNADYDAEWAGGFITPERYVGMLYALLDREQAANDEQ